MQVIKNGLETPLPAVHPQAGVASGAGLESCCIASCLRPARVWVNQQGACGRGHLALVLRAGLASEKLRNAKERLRLRSALPVGQLLLRAGSVNEASLAEALRAQERAGAGRLGAWLRQQSGLGEHALAAALAAQHGCAVLSLAEWEPESSLAPAVFFEQCGGIPLRGRAPSGSLAVAFEDEGSPEMLRALARIHGRPVMQGILPATGFWEAARTWLALRQPAVRALEAVPFSMCAEACSAVLHEADARSAWFAVLGDRVWLRYMTAGGLSDHTVVCATVPDEEDEAVVCRGPAAEIPALALAQTA